MLRLTLMLVISINLINSLVYIFHREAVAEGMNSEKADLGITILLVLSIINILSAGAIFAWKKIGVYALTISCVLMGIVDNDLGTPLSASIWPMLFLLALYASFYLSGTWTKLK